MDTPRDTAADAASTPPTDEPTPVATRSADDRPAQPGAEPASPEPSPPDPPGATLPRLRELVEALAIAIVFALFVRTFVVQAFKIPSGSMEDNLLVGDHILVNKFIYGPRASALEDWLLPVRDPRRGDVVVFKFPDDPGRDFIKRCIGLPGDEVEIVDKAVRVNGEALIEEGYKHHDDDRVYSRSSYLQPGFRRRDNFGPYLVPPESFFCLGDNRDRSHDSRLWTRTTVPKEYLKGRAVMVYWSMDPQHRPLVGGPAERAATAAGNLVRRVRTERLLQPVR